MTMNRNRQQRLLPYDQLEKSGIDKINPKEQKPTIPKPLHRYLKRQLKPYKKLLQQGVA
ncbi:MAG: hypothetical protein V6Z78_04430 [Holosporaceae bacterium]